MTITPEALDQHRLDGIAERAREWRRQVTDPIDAGPCPVSLEDVEALLADAYWARKNMRHHVVLVSTAREAAARVRRFRGDQLASEVNEAMRHVGAELGDLEERTN